MQREHISASLRYDLLRAANGRCQLCGVAASEGARLQVDHVVPVTLGGDSHRDNLQVLCDVCNLGKGKKGSEIDPGSEPAKRAEGTRARRNARAAEKAREAEENAQKKIAAEIQAGTRLCGVCTRPFTEAPQLIWLRSDPGHRIEVHKQCGQTQAAVTVLVEAHARREGPSCQANRKGYCSECHAPYEKGQVLVPLDPPGTRRWHWSDEGPSTARWVHPMCHPKHNARLQEEQSRDRQGRSAPPPRALSDEANARFSGAENKWLQIRKTLVAAGLLDPDAKPRREWPALLFASGLIAGLIAMVVIIASMAS